MILSAFVSQNLKKGNRCPKVSVLVYCRSCF